MPHHIRPVISAIAVAAGTLAATAVAWPAAAEPATTVAYPAWASATRYTGPAFDTCAAPPLSTMRAWLASPYRAIGLYVGGQNRTCLQPELTSSWVRGVADLGWRMIPIFKGRQAPCSVDESDLKILPSAATAEGTWAADNAAEQVRALGMFRGGAIYYDMEAYDTANRACASTVLTFLSAWTRELHRLGYVAGVYANLNLGASDLADTYLSTSYARPDALWIARYDGNESLTGWAGIGDSLWAVHQRAKQYRADFSATYGDVKLTIDADNWDATVATTAFTYRATALVRARTAPSPSYPLVKVYEQGASLPVVCQTPGSLVGTTRVWDKLNTGAYVTDNYVSTPSGTDFSPPITRCLYPYQITASGGVNERSGPGVTYPINGVLPAGALTWLVCQDPGSTVGSTPVWDKIDYRHWVSDYWVATPSKTTYSKPAPRC